MSVLFWLAANVVMVVFIIKAVKEKESEKKKKNQRIWLISLAIAVVMFFVIAAQGRRSVGEDNQRAEVEETKEDIANSTTNESVAQDRGEEPTEAVTPTETITPTETVIQLQDDGLSIEIEAGKKGEYGQELVLNSGTEFEDKTIGFFVPSGVYEITNIGDHPTQVNVYKNEKNVVDGWEEWADGIVERLDVNETKEMMVKEGYFINVDEPSHISIKQIRELSSNTTNRAEDKESLRETFNTSLGDNKPMWYESVRNDNTGNWRELVIYTDQEFDGTMAIDYAEAYIEADEEVHFVVNLYSRTTTCVRKIGNTLYVTIKEYRDKEEHDAKELGGGMVLKDFCVDMETGEVEIF